MHIRSDCLLPTLSAKPPQKNAPTIIPRYTMLPVIHKNTKKKCFVSYIIDHSSPYQNQLTFCIFKKNSTQIILSFLNEYK